MQVKYKDTTKKPFMQKAYEKFVMVFYSVVRHGTKSKDFGGVGLFEKIALGKVAPWGIKGGVRRRWISGNEENRYFLDSIVRCLWLPLVWEASAALAAVAVSAAFFSASSDAFAFSAASFN